MTEEEAFEGCWGVTDLSVADAKLHGEADTDQAGYAVAGAGDVDGDGFDDLLVSAYGYDSYRGVVYLVSGPVSGDIDLSTVTRRTGESSSTLSYAGNTVATAGDVDGDGFDDVLVGAEGDDGAATDAGAAYLLFGPITGDAELTSAGAKLSGESGDSYAGSWVTSGGDIDADGTPDLLIGARGDDEGGVNAGAAYLLMGPVTGDISLRSADCKLVGEDSLDWAGRTVAGAGDVNGDGLGDLLVGAHGDDDAGDSAGAAYLVQAPFTGDRDLSSADAKLTGEYSGDLAGYPVAGVGDTNADGYDDVLIGAFSNGTAATDAGAAYLVLGPITTDSSLASADAILLGEAANDNAGISLAGPGDVDLDGHDDLLVGASAEDSAGSQAGAAYLVLSPIAGSMSLTSADVKLQGESSSDFAGASVSGAGDVDADGFPELIIGATWASNASGVVSGAAYVVLGTSY